MSTHQIKTYLALHCHPLTAAAARVAATLDRSDKVLNAMFDLVKSGHGVAAGTVPGTVVVDYVQMTWSQFEARYCPRRWMV